MARPSPSPPEPRRLGVDAGGLRFAVDVWGDDDAPLALCLHGYPDTPRTWRHLGPHLAERGWRVAAPFTRGYAPTELAPDGAYQPGALIADAVALHGALGADHRAVLIGHDWGALTAYGTASFAPGLFALVVTLAVPPGPVVLGPLGAPRRLAADARLVPGQLRRSWYMGFQQLPWVSEGVLGRLVPKLWRDWSPGFDGREDAAAALEAMAPPGHATAALSYYRAMAQPWRHQPAYAAQQRHWLGVPHVPTLFLHGADDGCLTVALAERAAPVLPEGSRVEVVAGAGHFLQLEDPVTVNGLIADFVAP